MDTLSEVIDTISSKSKYYEKLFFPADKVKTPEGRFELLGLSILDVFNFNADKLWFEIAPKLREKNIISIDYLKNASVQEIQTELEKAGYRRGKYTKVSAERLKNLATKTLELNIEGDISNLFNSYEVHNKNTLKELLNKLKEFDGIGQKVGTMFIKFLISTFEEWKWRGNEATLFGIAIPNDFQVRKVYTRISAQRIENFEKDLSKFSEELKLSFSKIDDVFWNVGRIFCNNLNPSCHYCFLEPPCKYAFYRKTNNLAKLKEIDTAINIK